LIKGSQKGKLEVAHGSRDAGHPVASSPVLQVHIYHGLFSIATDTFVYLLIANPVTDSIEPISTMSYMVGSTDRESD
jgi:hypothetical protein